MNDNTQTDAGNIETADNGESAATPPDVSESSAEAERLRTENGSLKISLRMASAREAILNTLKKAGARSPELLFEAAKHDLQFTDEGELANSAAMLGRLRKSYPEQFGDASLHASIDGPAGQSYRPNYISRESLKQMTPEQIARLDWNDVKQILRGG